MTSVNDILDALKEIDKTTAFNVYLPSLNREVKFKQLNTQQFKQILKTVIDSPLYNTQFIITFNSLVKENCLEEIEIEKLTILDKLFVFYMIRIESLSPEYTFDTDTVNLKERYTEIIKNFKNLEPQRLIYENYSILCSVPTIATENKLEKELHQNININIESPEEFRAIIGDTFINEITKFISELKIGDKEISFEGLDFKTRIEIVEQLPTTIINDVLKYIESYKNIVNSLLVFEFTRSSGNIDQKEVPLDASFFNI